MFGKNQKNTPKSRDDEDDFTDGFNQADESFPEDDEASWGETVDEAEDDVMPAIKQQPSPLVRILPWAALGLVGAGGAAFFYMNGQTSAPAEPTAIVATPTVETAESQPVAESEPLAAAPDIVAEPAMETAVPADLAAVPAIAPVGEPNFTSPTAEATALAEPVKEADVTVPQPVETVDSPIMQPDIKAEVAAPLTTQPPASVAAAPLAMPAVTVAAQQQTAPSNKQYADMTSRIDVLEHQLDELTKTVDKLATQSNSAALSGLTAKVTQMQAALDKMAAAPAAVRESATQTRVANTTTATAPTARAAAPAWVLRAAQTGEAWVSRTAQGELQNVRVGETLAGIGRITAITETNGHWVITGTQGKIRQ